jgi:hypothetical protein
MIHYAYRCDEYVLVTDAAKKDFKRVLEQVKKDNEAWDIYDVEEALEEEDFIASVHGIEMEF